MRARILVVTGLMACVAAWSAPAMELTWLASDVRLDTDPAGEANSDYPQVAASGEDVYVIWQEDRNGYEDIYLNYSHDKGQTWLGTDRRINKNTAGATRSIEPRIAASGSRVYVVWVDTRNGTTDIFFNSSPNRGVSWRSSDIRLDTDAAGSSWSREPRMVASGSNVCVIWKDGRNNEWQTLNSLYANCSTDGGTTWQASDTALVVGAGAEIADHDLVVADGRVHVVLSQNRAEGENIYYHTTADWGASWQAEMRINDDTVGESRTPAIAADGGHVYVAWWHYFNYNNRLYFDHSANNGATWLANDVQLAWSGNPEIAVSGSSVYVLYPDNDSLLLQASHDRGATWLDTPTTVRGYDVKSFEMFNLLATGRQVLVAWRDLRCLDYSTWVNASGDSGATWEEYPDLLNDTGCGTGTANVDNPTAAIVAVEQMMYVVWDEYRGSKRDVFVNAGKWGIFAADFENHSTARWDAAVP